MRIRERLAHELSRRKSKNPRYSLRSLARDTGVHHSTLSRLMRGTRVEHRTLVAIGKRLNFSDAEIKAASSSEEAAAVLLAICRPDFHPDTRWLSVITGIPVDDVNIILQMLLRCGRLRMLSANGWWVEGVSR